MSDVAGSLGRGKLVILQPAFGGGAGVEVAIGLARWWGKQLKRAGRENTWLMMAVPGTQNPRQLQVFDAWPERHLAEMLAAGLQCRWGLAPEFTPRGASAAISARLFEVTDDGRIQTIGSWSYDGENSGVPAFAFEVAQGAARCLGARLASASWQDAFHTADDVACMWHLTFLGAVSLAEEGFATDAEAATTAMLATYQAAPTMQPAIDLMEDLLRAMATRLDGSELDLAAVLRTARAALGRSPPQWDGVIARAMQR